MGENYKIVMKELKEDTNSKTAPVHGLRLNIVKMSILQTYASLMQSTQKFR